MIPEEKSEEAAVGGLWRSPARYLWAMLPARLYESTPQVCSIGKADMRIVPVVTNGDSVRPIPGYAGERVDPRKITPARGLSVWETEVESLPLYEPVAQAEPNLHVDQGLDW